jgi:biotin transport system substrate-specific component
MECYHIQHFQDHIKSAPPGYIKLRSTQNLNILKQTLVLDTMEITIDSYRNTRLNFYRWRCDTAFVNKLALALAFAALTGVSAQFRLYLPFTPVPITGQVFAVLLCAVVLGRWYGGLSQVIYTGIGLAWIPWFAPKTGAGAFSSGGWSVVFGATGGYIIGFIIAAFVIGWLTDSYIKAREIKALMPIFLLGIGIIYTFGAAWLAFVIGLGIKKAIVLGVLPFVAVDIAKAISSSFIASAVLPKEQF